MKKETRGHMARNIVNRKPSTFDPEKVSRRNMHALIDL
jgi:hypothetical protein